MKKIVGIFFLSLLFFSCKHELGYKSPHEKRTLTVTNNTGRQIESVIIQARYNSVEYFSGDIGIGTTKTFSDVPLCMLIPESRYDWKVEKIGEHGDTPEWRIRDLTKNERLNVTVYNRLGKDITLKYEVKADGKYPDTKPLDKVHPRTITLYDTEYKFELNGQKQYYRKIDGEFDKSTTYPGLGDDHGPEWTTEPTLFTINYDKGKQTIEIKPIPAQ